MTTRSVLDYELYYWTPYGMHTIKTLSIQDLQYARAGRKAYVELEDCVRYIREAQQAARASALADAITVNPEQKPHGE